MFGVGMTELLVVAIIGLLLFGNRLPKVMKDMGRGINEFKHGLSEVTADPPADRPATVREDPNT